MRARLQAFWVDLKASTDASVLGILRFVGLLYGKIDTTLPIDQAFAKALRNPVPRSNWRHAFGGISYLLFIMLVGTGVLLSFYYRPSAEEAYQSVQHIVTGISFGWLMRDLHRWSANLIVLAILVHMARILLVGSYKTPRETNWLVGLLLLFVVLLFGATGYLLPWDQWAYWTTTQGVDAVGHLPLIGGWLTEVVRGDPVVSGATLSRFFAIHVILLPWAALGLLMLHFSLLRRQTRQAHAPATVPFFPNHALKIVSVGVLVIAVTATAAVLSPREVAAPADPAHPPIALQSTWVVADVSRALVHFLGSWGLALFIALGLALALVPLFDRSAERRISRRPVVAALSVAFFLLFGVAWLVGRRLRTSPADGELQRIHNVVPGPESVRQSGGAR